MDITKMVRDLACRLSKNETEILIKAKAFDRLKFINKQQDKLFGRAA